MGRKRNRHSGIKRFFGLVFATCMLLPAVAQAQDHSWDYNHGLGKLEIRSQSPAQSLRLTLPMLIPGDIKPGWGTHVHFTWTNVWAEESSYLLDYEMLDTIVTATYGFNKRFGLAVGFDNRSYFGGELDNFIQEFHDAFGIDQNGRDMVSRNRKVIQTFDPQTGSLLSESSASDMNNNGLGLLLNYNVVHGTTTWPSLNIYGLVRYATKSAEGINKDNPVDYGFGLGLSKRWWKRWYTYAALGYTLFDDCNIVQPTQGVEPTEFEDHQLTGMFALSWHYTPAFSILAQYLFNGPAIKNVDGLDEPSHEVHLGFKWRVGQYGLIEFALVENIITMDNSPDFGLHLGWSYVF